MEDVDFSNKVLVFYDPRKPIIFEFVPYDDYETMPEERFNSLGLAIGIIDPKEDYFLGLSSEFEGTVKYDGKDNPFVKTNDEKMPYRLREGGVLEIMLPPDALAKFRQ